MMMRKPVWFLLVNHKTARLMKGQLNDFGRCQVHEHVTMENQGLEKQYHRPTSRMGRQGSTQESRLHEESSARFIRKITTELDKLMTELKIEGVKLFAPAKMIGAFKKAVPNHLAGKVQHHQADLVHMKKGDLAKYPAVMDMVKTATPMRAA